MTPLELKIMQTLQEVGEYPSRFRLCADAGIDYAKGYYVIECMVARGLIELEQPKKTRPGKAVTIRLTQQVKL